MTAVSLFAVPICGSRRLGVPEWLFLPGDVHHGQLQLAIDLKEESQ
jgi:hypothetical protein